MVGTVTFTSDSSGVKHEKKYIIYSMKVKTISKKCWLLPLKYCSLTYTCTPIFLSLWGHHHQLILQVHYPWKQRWKNILERINYFYFIKFLATCACLTPEVMSYNSEKYKKQKKCLARCRRSEHCARRPTCLVVDD